MFEICWESSALLPSSLLGKGTEKEFDLPQVTQLVQRSLL